MTRRWIWRLACLLGSVTLLAGVSPERPAYSAERAARWEPDIAAFEAADRDHAPAKGGVLFLGSSSIRLWDLDRWFADLDALNRGFGGSETRDSVHFIDRVVYPYAPRCIVFYAGDNDIANGCAAAQVAEDFRTFTAKVWACLPETRLVYIAIKPSVDRWALVEEMRTANRAVAAFCAGDARLDFVDIGPPMLGEDGRPRPELFVEDGLHLNDAGYALWTALVKPLLGKDKHDG